MLAKLTCKSGPLANSIYYVRDEVVIGSDPGSAIHLRSGIVSASHARLFLDTKKNCFVVEDLNSFNGTKVDGEDIRGKKRLKTFHIILLANTFEFVFQVAPDEEEAAETPQAPEPLPEEEMMARTILIDTAQPLEAPAPVKEEPDEIYLEFKTTKGGQQSIHLKQGSNTVGRSATSDIVIDNPSISRHHAVVKMDGNALSVNDAGSRNGTFVDERRITEETTVAMENELKFGLVSAVLVAKKDAAKT
jgi:pSer/pThr/pTyr-binding forkhead associated (FHA) protein